MIGLPQDVASKPILEKNSQSESSYIVETIDLVNLGLANGFSTAHCYAARLNRMQFSDFADCLRLELASAHE